MMTKELNTRKAWAVMSPNGEILLNSIAITKSGAIAKYTKRGTHGIRQSTNWWDQDKRRGFKCVPVVVSQEEAAQ